MLFSMKGKENDYLIIFILGVIIIKYVIIDNNGYNLYIWMFYLLRWLDMWIKAFG